MTKISEVTARLRIVGDDLDPKEISRILGCEPTEATRKGERRPNPGSSRLRYARSGIWLLKSPLATEQPLEAHIRAILDGATGDIDNWKLLKYRFEVDIDIGLFLDHDNEEFWLSPDVVKLLGDRGIGLDIDIYALLDSDESDNESV